METFSLRLLSRYLHLFVHCISSRLDRSTNANYTTQFLGVQYFVDVSIVQYATNIPQNLSSVC
jgi:hypothetical protein